MTPQILFLLEFLCSVQKPEYIVKCKKSSVRKVIKFYIVLRALQRSLIRKVKSREEKHFAFF